MTERTLDLLAARSRRDHILIHAINYLYSIWIRGEEMVAIADAVSILVTALNS